MTLSQIYFVHACRNYILNTYDAYNELDIQTQDAMIYSQLSRKQIFEMRYASF